MQLLLLLQRVWRSGSMLGAVFPAGVLVCTCRWLCMVQAECMVCGDPAAASAATVCARPLRGVAPTQLLRQAGGAVRVSDRWVMVRMIEMMLWRCN